MIKIGLGSINYFRKEVLFIFLLITTFKINAQNISCEELIRHVKQNGVFTGNIGIFQRIESSWLKNVTAYSIENQIVVVAEIKKDETSLLTHEYVYCGIPKSNWESFTNPFNSDKTYGERFHLYIIDYKCNCNN
jgi:hypothetical protein